MLTSQRIWGRAIVSRSLGAFFLLLLLGACGTTSMVRYPPSALLPGRQSIVIVIDGTSNDPRDRTNAARLHELISNQNRSNLSIFYTEGVGSDGRLIGMATGWGMGKDVKDAYRFLAENWRRETDIYVFGFSRGAFGGRILSGLIHSAGVIQFERDEHGEFVASVNQRQAIVDRLYDAYLHPARTTSAGRRPASNLEDRRRATARVISAANLESERGIRIRAAGYWDTVAAMGLPDGTTEPWDENVHPYLDQFCNVDHVFHAVSLDDNRAVDFTPVLATDRRTLEACTSEEPRPTIREVWFSGAHADVGGTYSNEAGLEGHLAGNSLNWMIAQIHSLFTPDEVSLLPVGAGQYANPLDMIHNARDGLAVWRARPLAYRRPLQWVGEPGLNDATLRIHFTVVQRLERLFDIENSFSRQCARPNPRPPSLRCADSLEEHGFLSELIEHRCVTRIPPQDGPQPTLGGYRFSGRPERVAGAPEIRFVQSSTADVEPQCNRIVIAYDTEAQRDAYWTSTWAASSAIPAAR